MYKENIKGHFWWGHSDKLNKWAKKLKNGQCNVNNRIVTVNSIIMDGKGVNVTCPISLGVKVLPG